MEKAHSHYSLQDVTNAKEAELVESVKLYGKNTTSDGAFTYLGADTLSIIGKLANYTSEFIRIYMCYMFESDISDERCEEIRTKINGLIE